MYLLGSGCYQRRWCLPDGLTMVEGVEPGDGGVYVCDFDQLVHLRDTDGDGKADERRVVLAGYGSPKACTRSRAWRRCMAWCVSISQACGASIPRR